MGGHLWHGWPSSFLWRRVVRAPPVQRRKDTTVAEATSNYKTTIAGALSAGAYAWANAGNLDFKRLLVAVGMAVFAFLAKDA